MKWGEKVSAKTATRSVCDAVVLQRCESGPLSGTEEHRMMFQNRIRRQDCSMLFIKLISGKRIVSFTHSLHQQSSSSEVSRRSTNQEVSPFSLNPWVHSHVPHHLLCFLKSRFNITLECRPTPCS